MDYTLSRGAHPSAQDGRCAMEWVAYLAGERHSDQPQCVCPALREFTIRVNDAMPDELRQKLRPYLARMIGTAGDGRAPWRSYRLVDWVAREVAPLTMEATGRSDLARELRDLPPVDGFATAQIAAERLRRAAGIASLGPLRRHLLSVAATAARGRVPSQAAETAVLAATRVGVAGVWETVLGLLDQLLPGEVVEVPKAADWQAVCALAGTAPAEDGPHPLRRQIPSSDRAFAGLASPWQGSPTVEARGDGPVAQRCARVFSSGVVPVRGGVSATGFSEGSRRSLPRVPGLLYPGNP
jgi:hypothetical protein